MAKETFNHTECVKSGLHLATREGRVWCRKNGPAAGLKVMIGDAAPALGRADMPSQVSRAENADCRRCARSKSGHCRNHPADYITQHIYRSRVNHEARARMDRIQPKRSGARVSGRFSTCVQAALHIDAHGGRCACGWVANKAS